MKSPLNNLNKTFENRVRLGVMSILMVNDWVTFNTLKENLDLTDGNLASHLNHLEKKEYLSVSKEFVKRKPQTSYRATETGIKAFRKHIDALEKILKQNS